jgi:hypothetical protein
MTAIPLKAILLEPIPVKTVPVQTVAPGSARTAEPAPIPLSRIISVELRKSFDTRSGFWLLASSASPHCWPLAGSSSGRPATADP